MGGVEDKALANTLAVTLAKGSADTLDKTNCKTVEEAVANRLGDTSAMWRPRHWSIHLLTFYPRRIL